MTQLELLVSPPAKPAPPTLDERFATFHVENPHVFDELLRLARVHLDRGDQRIGVKALWEELRASLSTRTDAGDFKLNNSYTAIYARHLLAAEPRLDGVIEVRRRRCA
jgi:hypothetical protein